MRTLKPKLTNLMSSTHQSLTSAANAKVLASKDGFENQDHSISTRVNTSVDDDKHHVPGYECTVQPSTLLYNTAFHADAQYCLPRFAIL